jgi:hypothetical protein
MVTRKSRFAVSPRGVAGEGGFMSANAILAELPSLSQQELEAVDAKVHELLGRAVPKHWGDALAELAGSVKEGLPEDYAQNHDHYLHGASRR